MKMHVQVVALLVSGLTVPPCFAQAPAVADAAFSGVRLADAKGKQTDARLVFSDTNKTLVVKVADHEIVSAPYDQLDKFSYEYTKKHRITQGAVVMVASLGAGAIVMMTKSKSHWLYIDFHEQNAPKTVVLRVDKKEYKRILDAIKTHTGKNVEFLGDAKSKEKKDAPQKESKANGCEPLLATGAHGGPLKAILA